MAFEGWVFAGTDWNDRTNFIMQGFDPGVAPKRWQWASGADSDGALPVEEAHYDNAEMTVRVRIAPQANMDAALAKIGTLVQALQECEKQPLGSAGVWTPATSTKSLTAYIVGGEVTGIPIAMSGDDAGWFLRTPAPVVEMKLYRRPFLYGTEVVSAATVTNSSPVQTLTLANVPGDVAAEARLIVSDPAPQTRRHLEWGLEQRYYNAATSLLIDEVSLVTSGFAGTGTTRAGAYDSDATGNTVIRATLTGTPLAVCGLGNLGHVGTFRVKARVFPIISTGLGSDMKVRLSWKEGDGPLRSNEYDTIPTASGAFSEVDLGIVSIPEKKLGTQRWTGQIEAYSSTAGDTIDIDYIMLFPVAEGYGKARALIAADTPTAYSARDEFNQTAGALTGKVAAQGGTYVAMTGSDTDDFTVDSTTHYLTRTAVSDTGTLLGRSVGLDLNLTNMAVQIDWTASVDQIANRGLFARAIDNNNHMLFAVGPFFPTQPGLVQIVGQVRVGGSQTSGVVGTATISSFTNWQQIRLMVDSTGHWYAFMAERGQPLQLVLTGQDNALATGGALATGDAYIWDQQTAAGAVTRYYDNFQVWVPILDAAVFSGRAAEIRSDSTIRQDSTGTYYGNISTYRGSRFYVPPAGSAGRTSRVIGKARRNDVDVFADDQIADSTTWTVNYTPRYWAAPR